MSARYSSSGTTIRRTDWDASPDSRIASRRGSTTDEYRHILVRVAGAGEMKL
ncbi:hypothetical protein P4H54_06300 [Paenibacillus graminis]|uniref:hypothetical protein n=1 Tax=Paenibacillus graminis TaxID=189425 RepID=UPI002DB87FB0|nr:hypothetical protein [Paenibacillus graminis]MEC0167974.1 hypothetical protein [Paenibacillus graminis]